MASVRTQHSLQLPQAFWGVGAVAEMSDRQLLEFFSDRREARAELAFEALIQRYGPMVLGVCRQLLGDSNDAEDAFQATFIVLARKAGSIQRPELLGHWLYGVAVRTSRKARALRGRQRWETIMASAEAVDHADGHGYRLVRDEEAEALHEEIGRLHERYRLPIVLCYLEGLTHAEAAERLHWPMGTLSVRLKRARDVLRERLTRRGLTLTAGLLTIPALPETASATVPSTLTRSTVRLGLEAAAGHALSAGTASATVALLAHHVLAALVSETLVSLSVMVALMAGLVISGAGALAPSSTADRGKENTSAGRTSARRAPMTLAASRGNPELRDEIVGSMPSGNHRRPEADTGRDLLPDADSPLPEKVAADPLPIYRLLQAKAGRDASAQVRLALWCEANGLAPERIKHLALAILIDPSHATARGLLGLVSYRGHWRRLDEVADKVRGDAELSAVLAEYNAKRQKTLNTADAQWRLALWCEQKGLKAEMTAHLAAVTQLDSGHEGAWKRLGYKRHNGFWMTEAQVAAERAEADARRKADRRWKPLLTKWRNWLLEPARREDAERNLANVTDPRAVPSIWAVFGVGGRADQARAVQLLGQVDVPAGTLPLTGLAVASPWAEVRRAASETLGQRDRRGATNLLVGLLRDPNPNPNSVVYRFQMIPTGAAGIGSPGITFVEGRRANLLRVYTVDESLPGRGNWILPPSLSFSMPDYERRVANQRMAQMNELITIVEGLMEEARREVGPASASIRMVNARVIQTLRNILGEDRGDDWEPWVRWWVEEKGYAYDPDQFRNPPDLSVFEPKPTFVSQFHTSCFGAGTPVRTLTGPRPIESIRVGDVVLTQNTTTGALDFAPVLAVAHNEPTPTLRIVLGDESIVATSIHRFWKAGRGWVMARDLKPGDAIRTFDGLVKVAAVSSDRVRPVFNLEVGEARTFFVGRSGALVHDNSQVEPVSRPFDAVPDSVATALKAKSD